MIRGGFIPDFLPSDYGCSYLGDVEWEGGKN